jgi:hypothetical protein
MVIDVGKEYFYRLANRDKNQGDGTHNAEQFRKKYLSEFDSPEEWRIGKREITFDFTSVEILGPSFANEAFAYFTKYASPENILKRFHFINISEVKMDTINEELTEGYRG